MTNVSISRICVSVTLLYRPLVYGGTLVTSCCVSLIDGLHVLQATGGPSTLDFRRVRGDKTDVSVKIRGDNLRGRGEVILESFFGDDKIRRLGGFVSCVVSHFPDNFSVLFDETGISALAANEGFSITDSKVRWDVTSVFGRPFVSFFLNQASVTTVSYPIDFRCRTRGKVDVFCRHRIWSKKRKRR